MQLKGNNNTPVFENPFEKNGRHGRLLAVDLKKSLDSGNTALYVMTDIRSSLHFVLDSSGGTTFKRRRASADIGSDPALNMLYIGSIGLGILDVYLRRGSTDTAFVGIELKEDQKSVPDKLSIERGADILQDCLAHQLGLAGYAVSLVTTENVEEAIAINNREVLRL